MTEKEWLKATDAQEVLEEWPWAVVSERKMRLFGCACCRRIWSLITAPESRKAVEVSEALADGLVRDTKRRAAHDAAVGIARRERTSAPVAAEEASARLLRAFRKTASVAEWAARTAYHAVEASYTGAYEATGTNDRVAFNAGNRAQDAERRAQIALLRDIFGNPFRPVAFDPAWRTSTAVAIARGMYEPRDFTAMPILADALQDEGCACDDILNHCRRPGQHVRGCWVVDLVLDKS